MDSNFDSKVAANCPEDCEIYVETHVEAYLDGTLSDSDREAFEERFFSCQKCFQAVQFRQEYKSFIKQEAIQQLPELVEAYSPGSSHTAPETHSSAQVVEMPAPQENRRRSMWPYLRIAAILVLVSGFAYFWSGGEISTTPFTVNSSLEKAMTGEVRSGEHLTIYSPQIGEEMDGQISFNWAANDSDIEIPELQLVVLDNQAAPIHEALVSGGSYQLDKELAPGLYYWELATQGSGFESGKTLFLGKFTVIHPE